MNKKHITTAFILGIIVAAFAYHAYVVYQVRKVTIQNSTSIAEIVNFINNSQKPATTAAK